MGGRRTTSDARLEFLAPASFQLATAIGGRADARTEVVASREATYFDSADLALAAQGTTLVLQADDDTWVLDSADGAPGENPFVVSVAGKENGESADAEPRVPAAIRDRLHTRLRSRSVRAVARITVNRTTIDVCCGPTPAVHATHDDVTARAGGDVRRYGRVVLVPTEPGPLGRAMLSALADACTAAGCTYLPRCTDLQLACGVLSQAGAAPQPALPHNPRSAALTDLVAPMLGASVARLFAHDLGVRLDTDPEDVHQLRVATRRLRAGLRALRPVLDPPRTEQLRAEASWLGSLAGPVRDADVLLDRLKTSLATLPEPPDQDGSLLLLRLTDQRRRDREALLNGMRTARYDVLLDALVDAVTHPPVRNSRTGRRATIVLRRSTARQWKRFVEAVDLAGPAPSAADLHKVRIAAKHARYTADAAAPVLGKHAGRLAGLATQAQTLLGDLHDAVVAQAWLQDAAGEQALAGVAEQLTAVERARAAELQAQWPPLWAAIAAQADHELRALAMR